MSFFYSLLDSATTMSVYTSYNSWLNNQGHFESRFQFEPFFGKVPSISVGASDITTFFNLNFTINVPNSGGSGSGGSGSDNPDKDSIWDKLFGSIGDLVKKIIEGIGTVIADVVDGLTGVVDSIIGAIESFISNFTEGTIIEFLQAFFIWLPDPLPDLLGVLFTLAVIFAVVKLVKGALS